MLTFSIITCTYNASAFIDRTLDSVLNQTYPHIQHIIVDGVSKDDTIEKIYAYGDTCLANSSHSVEAHVSPDKGLYDAMNKGIEYATGDYLVFLNAGDVLATDDTIQQIASQIEERCEPLPGVIYGDTDITDNNGQFLRKRRLSPPECLSWRSFRNGMLVCHQSFYALTSIAKSTPYNLHYRLSADVDWCIRIMKEAAEQDLPLHNTHLTLCSYLEGGMSVKNHRASLMERFNIMRHHYGLATTIAMHLWFVVRGVIKK